MPSSPARLLTRFITGFGLLALAVFSLVEKGPSRALQWPWFFYAQLLWLTPVLWLVVQGLATGRLARLGGALDWALLGFAAANVAAALASPFPAASVAQLPCVLAPVALAYALAAWLNDGDDTLRANRAAWAVNAGAILLATATVSSLAWWVLGDVAPRLANGAPWLGALAARNEHPLGHSNYTAGFGLLTVAWLVGAAQARRGAARFALVLGVLAGFVALLSSGSRGGFLGLGAWGLGWIFAHARRAGWPLRRIVPAALLVAAAGCALTLAHPRTRQLWREWRAVGTLNPGDRQRLAMAEFGRQVVADHPLLGIGPGATPSVYPSYRARLSGGVEAALELHSTPLQLAVDGGLPALAALALALGLGLWRGGREPTSTAGRTLAAPAGALLAYAAMALTDYQLDVPLFAAAVGAGLGLCGGSGAPAGVPPIRRGRLAGGLLAALVLAWGGRQIPAWTARVEFNAAVASLARGDPVNFERALRAAAVSDPTDPLYPNSHALILADVRAYPEWFPPVDLGADRGARAIERFRASLAAEPDQELAHFNLGWLLVRDEPAEAEGHFRAAAQLVPDKGNVYTGLALARLGQHKPGAAEALAMEVVDDPAFVTSPAWALGLLPPELGPCAREIAVAELERIARDVGDDSLGAGRRARYAAELLRWLDGDGAARVRALALAEPSQQALLKWLGGEPIASGDDAAAWRTLERAAAAPDRAVEILNAHYARLRRPVQTPSLAAMAEVLAAPDRRRLLQPPGETSALLTWARRERTAYGLLMRNLDGPPPRDLYLVPENRIVRDFLAGLFPPKGYLPAPQLTATLARLLPAER